MATETGLLDRLGRRVDRYRFRLRLGEKGRVASVGDGIAWIHGLPSAAAEEILHFEDKGIYIKGGFAEVNPTTVTGLAEHAFIVEETDPRQLEDELAKAEAALKDSKDDEAMRHVTRAIEQLKALRGRRAA